MKLGPRSHKAVSCHRCGRSTYVPQRVVGSVPCPCGAVAHTSRSAHAEATARATAARALRRVLSTRDPGGAIVDPASGRKVDRQLNPTEHPAPVEPA